MDEQQELLVAKTALAQHGITLSGSPPLIEVVVRYRKSPGRSPSTGTIAFLQKEDQEWEVMVQTSPYFWGPDWASHPQIISTGTIALSAAFLLDALKPRMDQDLVIEVWRPRGRVACLNE